MSNYKITRISQDVYLLRLEDRDTKFFEALWEIPEGVTYNAYLVKTGEGAVLIDGWKSSYSSKLIDVLESLIKPDELRYVIVNHMEPDHTGSLEDVLRWSPKASVIGHPMVKRMIDSFPRAKEKLITVKDGESVEIGGKKFTFIHLPWLHWPETMITLLEPEQILFTCDVFGGFGIPVGVFDDECLDLDSMLYSMRKYVVTVIGSYRKWIIKGLEKLEKLEITPKMIATGHGLLWRKNISKVLEYYRSLAEGKPEKGKILVVYASMYGSLEAIVWNLVYTLKSNGYKPVVYGYTDTHRPLLSDILADAIDAEALVIAAPTYEADLFPLMKHVCEEICAKASGEKKLIVLADYAWGGIAAKRIRGVLESCGYNTVGSLEVKTLSYRTAEELKEAISSLIEKI